MKDYKRIRRIFEDTEAQTDQQMLEPAQSAAPAPVQEPLPALPQSTASSDPMSMTVGDFLNKVRSLEPLVAMGLESFIEKNMGSFTATNTAPAQTPDLSFSSQVQPTTEPDLSFSSQVPTEAPPTV